MTIRTIPAVLFLLLGVTAVEAAPVSVRLPEGNTRGFLVLRSPDGEVIAHGELRQKPAQGLIVPAFVRFEGAMFLNGPRWRIEMTTPEWPR